MFISSKITSQFDELIFVLQFDQKEISFKYFHDF